MCVCPSGNLPLKGVLPHGPNDVTGAVAGPTGGVQVAQEHNDASQLQDQTVVWEAAGLTVKDV